MSARLTLVLLALLVGLGAVAFVVQGPGSPDRTREHAMVFPGLAAGDVTLVRATRAAAEVLLTREGGEWKVGAAKETADANAVEVLLTNLAQARVGALVSTNAAKQSAYETDAGQGIAVRIEGPGGKDLASFIIGKRGPDFASCYLRREGKSEVLLVTPDLRMDFSRPVERWREPPKKADTPAPTTGPQ